MKSNHSNQLLEKWGEEAKGRKKKKRRVESEHVGFQGPETLLKGTPGGSPSRRPVIWATAWRGPGRILTHGFPQPKLVWPCKQNLKTFLH